MHGLAIALNIGGLIAALVITAAAGLLVAVAAHGKTVVTILSILLVAAAVFALPVWSMSLAWNWVPGSGVAVWIIPGVYLALMVPLAKMLFGGASAGAQP